MAERLLQSDIGQWSVRNRFSDSEFLSVRQADYSCQGQLVDIQLILSGNQALLLCLQLDVSAQHVNARDDAVLVLIGILLIKRLCRIDLSADGIYQGRVGDHEKVRVARCENNEVAVASVRKLGSLLGLRRGLDALYVRPIENLLR